MDAELAKIMNRPWADGSLHAVNLVRDQKTGKVLFCHHSKFDDPHSALELWPNPVGTAWGTYLEVWIQSSTAAHRLYPAEAS